MKSRIVIAATIGWFGGVGLLAVAMTGTSWSGIVPAVGGTSLSAHADSGDLIDLHPGERDFSDVDALQRITVVGQEQVSASLATARTVHEAEVPAIVIDGHLIVLGDFRLVEFRFEPQAKLIRTSVNAINTSTGFPKPTDAWVAIWLREDVPVPEWGGVLTTLKVVAVIEDGTGKVRSVHVGKFNPLATEEVIPSPSPAVARCTEDPSGLPGNRVCFR